MRNFLLIIVLLILSGCAPVVSREARLGADITVTPAMAQREPDAYRNMKVIWTGTIVSVKNMREKSIIEVHHLASEKTAGEPESETSSNRFLIDVVGFLDPATYRKGLKIVTAGTIRGIVIRKLYEKEYPYPVIEPVEMHLFNGRDGSPSSP